jgi:hypothetical protein
MKLLLQLLFDFTIWVSTCLLVMASVQHSHLLEPGGEQHALHFTPVLGYGELRSPFSRRSQYFVSSSHSELRGSIPYVSYLHRLRPSDRGARTLLYSLQKTCSVLSRSSTTNWRRSNKPIEVLAVRNVVRSQESRRNAHLRHSLPSSGEARKSKTRTWQRKLHNTWIESNIADS